MNTETRFDDLYQECKRHAKTARLIQPVAHGNWLVAIESMPGVFLMVKGNASPHEVACQLAIRHVEAEARQTYLERASVMRMQGSEVMQ